WLIDFAAVHTTASCTGGRRWTCHVCSGPHGVTWDAAYHHSPSWCRAASGSGDPITSAGSAHPLGCTAPALAPSPASRMPSNIIGPARKDGGDRSRAVIVKGSTSAPPREEVSDLLGPLADV